MSEYTTLRIRSTTWKRINVERNPRESLADVADRLLNERDRLKRLIKVDAQLMESMT